MKIFCFFSEQLINSKITKKSGEKINFYLEPADDLIIDRIIQEKLNESVLPTFFVHCIESAGDVVACEPIARYLKEKVHGCKVKWIITSSLKSLVEFNPNIDEVIEVSNLDESIDLIQEIKKTNSNILVDCHYDGRPTPTNRIHINKNNPMVNTNTYFDYGCILENFCLAAGLNKIDLPPKFYLNPNIENPVKTEYPYIVFHCVSAEHSKEWDEYNWKPLAKYIIKNGFDVVELGLQKTVNLKNDHFHDMTSENDLQVCAKIVHDAAAIIGIDSLFAHIANCFDVYGILIFGKFKNFVNQMPYSGNYKNGKNTNIIFAEDEQPACEVPLKTVKRAFDEWREKR